MSEVGEGSSPRSGIEPEVADGGGEVGKPVSVVDVEERAKIEDAAVEEKVGVWGRIKGLFAGRRSRDDGEGSLEGYVDNSDEMFDRYVENYNGGNEIVDEIVEESIDEVVEDVDQLGLDGKGLKQVKKAIRQLESNKGVDLGLVADAIKGGNLEDIVSAREVLDGLERSSGELPQLIVLYRSLDMVESSQKSIKDGVGEEVVESQGSSGDLEVGEEGGEGNEYAEAMDAWESYLASLGMDLKPYDKKIGMVLHEDLLLKDELDEADIGRVNQVGAFLKEYKERMGDEEFDKALGGVMKYVESIKDKVRGKKSEVSLDAVAERNEEDGGEKETVVSDEDLLAGAEMVEAMLNGEMTPSQVVEAYQVSLSQLLGWEVVESVTDRSESVGADENGGEEEVKDEVDDGKEEKLDVEGDEEQTAEEKAGDILNSDANMKEGLENALNEGETEEEKKESVVVWLKDMISNASAKDLPVVLGMAVMVMLLISVGGVSMLANAVGGGGRR